ncbi:MAG: DNA-processing protein DprA [Planctomycetota bacterium]|jgi:DNA processing protein|nr:DNA-processing protein DprA [Planctomycetota bacterium]MDG2141933.1 DNA-processing protein DprA [Planctomycetota bacterium]
MHSLTPASANWPACLTTIDSPPTKLWARGDPGLLAPGPRIAIVGSRSPTPYGEAQARRFAIAFAEAGITIVSGLARGIDSFAHAGALDAGGKTIGILGCGVDRPWPPGPLATRMLDQGLLLSEFEPGSSPRRSHFPQRNRIISGLADAVLVVEAAHASGSLITAHWAADQGRDVFALPGRVDNPMSRGCHRLIREGAELVESPAAIIESLGNPRLAFGTAGSRPLQREDSPSRDPLLDALEGETLSTDELVTKLGVPTCDLLPKLAELELAGSIIRSPGNLWRLPVHGA